MHRFFLPPEECAGAVLTLGRSESHHAVKVLRLREGDRVSVLDGAGQELACEITRAHAAGAGLAVLGRRRHAAPACEFTLLQGIPKSRSMDFIVQKATELGAHRLVPLLTSHGVVQLEAGDAAAKVEKWRSIATESVKQCGSPWLPRIELPLTPAAWLRRHEAFELSLIASLQPGARHPRRCFTEFTERKGRPPATVCAWVGPEGDFSEAEITAACAAGAQPVTLGPRVLRSETAAVAMLVLAEYELSAPRGRAQ
jgi:16S rRNA (uracil1498-N3)-methyltransferase